MNSDANPSSDSMAADSTGDASVKPAQSEQDALWQQFVHAEQDADFYRGWLALHCQHTHCCMRGVLVLGAVDTGPFSPAAYWPTGQGGSEPLASLAEQVLSSRKGMALKYEVPGVGTDNATRHGLAYPILIDEHLYGVVAQELMPVNQAELQTAMQQLQWATGWLEAHLRKQQAVSDNTIRERLVAALDLVASSLEQEHFQVAAKNFVTELATQLGCERVSIGFVRRGYVRVEAVSHSAQFGKQMNLICAIAAAMDEAVDQQTSIQYPPVADDEISVSRNHAALAADYGTATVLTIPLFQFGRVYGALCLERSTANQFDAATLELCRSVAAVAGPVLEQKRSHDRWLIVKALD